MGIYKKTLYILTFMALVPHINADDDQAITSSSPPITISDLSCTIDGQMTLTVPDSVNGVHVICTPNDATTATPSSTASPGSATLNDTTVTITNCEKNTPAILLLFPSTLSTTPNSVILSTSGAAQVSLTCTSINNTAHVKASLQINGPTLASKTVTETVDPVTMTLRKGVSPYAPIDDVTIGGSYIIVISGVEPYFKKITSCKASATNENVDSGTEVFNKTISPTTNVLSKATISPAMETAKYDILPHDAVLSLTGFRLVGSTTVYLKCSVDVCMHQSCGPVRKRKGHTGHPKVRYATMNFKVKDRILRTSSNGSKGIHSSARSFVLLFIVTILRYNTF